MKPAERFRVPLITLIDTPGAYPGVGSEERNQREAIARNLFETGGLAAPSGDGFADDDKTDLAALVAAFKASGAKLACLCGSDEGYAAEATQAAKALAEAGATIWLAGRPGELEGRLREAGVENFVFAGTDAVAALQDALAITTSSGQVDKE